MTSGTPTADYPFFTLPPGSIVRGCAPWAVQRAHGFVLDVLVPKHLQTEFFHSGVNVLIQHGTDEDAFLVTVHARVFEALPN